MRERALVMAIVNVTPDSFSDGGRYHTPVEALARARNCLREGADILDFGGESTRPDATPISWQEEWARLEPVFAGLGEITAGSRARISVDTYHPETAARAVEAGAHIVNCVYAEPLDDMASLCRATGAALVAPCRSAADFERLAAYALGERLAIDPMVGFGTTREEDLALLGSLRRLARLAPVVVGVSRKRLIKRITGERRVGKNLGGSLGAATWCAMNGASCLRVHDVAETRQAIEVAAAFAQAAAGESGAKA